MNEENEYYIPENVNARFELFKGYGLKELGIHLLFLIPGAIFAFLFHVLFHNIIATILPVPLFLGIGFFAVFRDPRQGRNALELFKDSRRYQGKPKRYIYRFGSGGM